MSRPIPEGVRRCTEHGPGFHPYCPACAIDSGKLPIAADRESEVARLNQNETLLGEFVRTHNEGTTPSVAVEDLKEPDKDALIRELIERWRAWSKPGNSEYDQGHYDRIAVCADELELLTTPPSDT